MQERNACIPAAIERSRPTTLGDTHESCRSPRRRRTLGRAVCRRRPILVRLRNPTCPGFYIGAQGGLNWLLNNQSYVMDTGWAVGGKVGYDFVGPRFEVEGMYHYNTGSAVVIFPTGYANVTAGSSRSR